MKGKTGKNYLSGVCLGNADDRSSRCRSWELNLEVTRTHSLVAAEAQHRARPVGRRAVVDQATTRSESRRGPCRVAEVTDRRGAIRHWSDRRKGVTPGSVPAAAGYFVGVTGQVAVVGRCSTVGAGTRRCCLHQGQLERVTSTCGKVVGSRQDFDLEASGHCGSD